jgi:FAD/FMN-containing dehydrogenase
VRNYEVVLSDGRIVNANVDENRDLWQVLKGGGGNFGIITRFDLNAIDFADPADPSIWGGPVAHNNTQTDSVIKAFVNFASNVAYDPASTLVSGWAYNAADGYTITGLLANTANVANASVFDEYRSIAQTSSRLQHGSMTNLTALSDNSQRT